MIGITENLTVLEYWILTAPEISCVVKQFIKASDREDHEELSPHEEGSAYQYQFLQVTDLLDAIMSRGYLLEETNADLITLDNKVCTDESAAAFVHVIVSKYQEQCDNFQEEALDTNNIPFKAPIETNNLLLFHEQEAKKIASLKKKVQHYKQPTSLYGQLLISTG